MLCLQAEGKKLGLVGWVQNTDTGTVQGQLQGPASKVQQMQHCLQTTGSPQSRIAKAEFKNEHTVDKLDFKDFKVVRWCIYVCRLFILGFKNLQFHTCAHCLLLILIYEKANKPQYILLQKSVLCLICIDCKSHFWYIYIYIHIS